VKEKKTIWLSKQREEKYYFNIKRLCLDKEIHCFFFLLVYHAMIYLT